MVRKVPFRYRTVSHLLSLGICEGMVYGKATKLCVETIISYTSNRSWTILYSTVGFITGRIGVL
jgi:hypothetical protein